MRRGSPISPGASRSPSPRARSRAIPPSGTRPQRVPRWPRSCLRSSGAPPGGRISRCCWSPRATAAATATGSPRCAGCGAPRTAFVYEVVPVGSFEDAFCAAVVNPDINAVTIVEGFAYASRHPAPVLREVLAGAGLDASMADDPDLALALAKAIKRVRPELDIYLLSDRRVEALAGDPRGGRACGACFYAIEEPLELHLSILEGVAGALRDALLRQPQEIRAAPDRHLPRAADRARQVDLQVRLDPRHGRVLRHQPVPRREQRHHRRPRQPAGADRQHQAGAGHGRARLRRRPRRSSSPTAPSTSNKMVHQALIAPGDIVIVDRNCHKSHHYGLVLAGGAAALRRGLPDDGVLDVRRGAARARIKQALLDLKAEGRLDRVKMVDLTNCTFDGHIYNTRRVMEECLAIKPDLIFLWDEAWFGFARFSPFLRPRTAMGAAEAIEEWLARPGLAARPMRSSRPSSAPILPTRRSSRRGSSPIPRKVRLRVYQTNSTHKSMSALRQGSMVLVKDVDFHDRRGAVPGGGLHACLDLPQPAAHRQPRRRAPADGARGLRAGAERDRDRARRSGREINAHPLISKYFKVLGADEHDPGGVPPERLRRLPRAGHHLGRRSSGACARTSSASIRRA